MGKAGGGRPGAPRGNVGDNGKPRQGALPGLRWVRGPVEGQAAGVASPASALGAAFALAALAGFAAWALPPATR